MEKLFYFPKAMLLTLALFLASAAAMAQDPAREAMCDGQESMTAPMIKAASARVPMPKRVGDVNEDGSVNISDVTSLIDILLTSSPASTCADVNRDGNVNISDVTALIDMLLTGENAYEESDAFEALDDIYRSMRTAGWSTTGNTHQSFGISAYNLVAEVMGDDMIMGAQGSGWFWFDAAYNVKTRYTSGVWRSYDIWTACYTWIADANYLIKTGSQMNAGVRNYITGQAYAIRAYSYFTLAQWFARTYKGHESEPCVPIFNGTDFTGSTGQPRSTVSQVYAQIDADINQAISLLNGTTQQKSDHIGYAVAQGLTARIALVKEDWSTAYSAAIAAINASGKTTQEVSAFAGLNDASAGNVMWGADIPADEVGMYASFWAHMSNSSYYAQRAPKQISKWLYNKMSATDTRRNWWQSNTTGVGSDAFVQNKFNVVDGTEWEGDYIYMRIEEMYLTAAEAACRRNLTNTARNNLMKVMEKRDANYSCTKSGTSLGALTTDETGSLLEEILIQRRLELWGEDGRIMTIRRLRQGFERTTANGWTSGLLLPGKALSDPESYAWVLTIPQSEFTGNANMNPECIPVGDQNPLGDVTGAGQNVSFETATSSLTTANTDFYYTVTLKRASTVGEYVTRVTLTNPVEGLAVSGYVNFENGSNTAVAQVSCYPLTLGQTYTGRLTLSDYDKACYSGDSQLSIHTFTIHCQNGNPAGQAISFQTASSAYTTSGSSMSVPVTLTRATTDEEYSATLVMSTAQSNISLSNTSVFFAKGVSTAMTWIYVNNMEYNQTYSCNLSLSPVDAATGGAVTSMQITVARENWIYQGYCNYEVGMLGASH